MTNTVTKVLVIEDDADIRGLIIKVIKGMDLIALEAQTINDGT